MIDPVLEISFRWALSLLLAAAAWHKAFDRRAFQTALRGYALLPAALIPVASALLPGAEAVIALGLLCSPAHGPAAFGACAILLLYAGAIGINLARGRRHIDCGCFASPSGAPLSTWWVPRNVGLAAMAWASTLPIRPRPLVWVDWLTITAGVGAISLLWLTSQRLAQNGPALRRLRGQV